MSKTLTIICLNCNKEHTVPNRHSCFNKYCSNECQLAYQSKQKIHKWLHEDVVPGPRVIKKYLIETFGNVCYTCGISDWNNKPITLETEHKDGNSENNKLENLCLLCPNCHSQTATYKNRNKGNGRHSRRVRYAEGKSY